MGGFGGAQGVSAAIGTSVMTTVSTLSGNATPSATTGVNVLLYAPGGEHRNVTFPANPSSGCRYVVRNTLVPATASSTWYVLRVYANDGTLLGIVLPNEEQEFVHDGSAWIGNGVISPAMPGIVAWFDAASGTYSDTGFATPATADNTGVGGWRDLGGRGWHVTQATAGNKPKLRTNVVNGRSVLRFAAASSQVLTGAGSQALHGAYGVVSAVARTWSADAYETIFEVNYGNAQGQWLGFTGSSAHDWATKSLASVGNGANNGSNNGPYGSLTDSTFHVVSALAGGGGRARVDGADVQTTWTPGMVVSGGTFQIGGNAAFGNHLDGDLQALILFDGEGVRTLRRLEHYVAALNALTVA